MPFEPTFVYFIRPFGYHIYFYVVGVTKHGLNWAIFYKSERVPDKNNHPHLYIKEKQKQNTQTSVFTITYTERGGQCLYTSLLSLKDVCVCVCVCMCVCL